MRNSTESHSPSASLPGRSTGLGRAVAAFVVGAGLGALMYAGLAGRKAPEVGHSRELSATTSNVLSRTTLPVQIRYYSVLDTNTVSLGVQEFAERVGELLEAYAAAGAGKVTVVRAAGQGAMDGAAKEGLIGFNREKGDVCYLGVVIAGEARKEVLPRLDPGWETALEADVSRALERVSAPLPSPVKASPSVADAAAMESVKRQLPDLHALSLEEATQKLRQAGFEEFRKTVAEMQPALGAAQERLKTAAAGADQDAARQELLRLQNDQTERLKEIAARSQAQIDALKELKRNP